MSTNSILPPDDSLRGSTPHHPARQLIISTELLDQMRQHVARLAPEEACGLISGKADRAHQVLPISNQLHSPVRYFMTPDELLQALIRMDEIGLELVAIYHSHPAGPGYPSSTDIAEAFYPEAIYIIWFPDSTGWSCKGFTIREGIVRETRISITEIE